MTNEAEFHEEEYPLAPFYRNPSEHCKPTSPTHISVMARYNIANIPQEYRAVFLGNSPAKDEQSGIYSIMHKYVASFTNEEARIKNIYMYSREPGTGKTTTAVAVLNEYIRRRYIYYVSINKKVPETLGIFLDLNEFQTRYNLASMANDDESMGDIRDNVLRYQAVEFLVIDDLGVRKATESFRALVHSIINYRVTAGLPTVFTSNVRMKEMEGVFDSRLYDRIKDQTLDLTFSGTSKRGVR